MKITAQLSGVNSPLSVELMLISFCSCGFDSQEEHDTSFAHGVLTKRSDFRSAKGLVRYSPFGGDQGYGRQVVDAEGTDSAAKAGPVRGHFFAAAAEGRFDRQRNLASHIRAQ